MLRAILLVLIVANAGYFGWTRGAFAAFGYVPARLTETEPQRLTNQLRPALLQIRRDDGIPPAVAPAIVAPAVENAAPAVPAAAAAATVQ